MRFCSEETSTVQESLQISIPGSNMNVFDRNINFDALFKFSQMYVSMQLIDTLSFYPTITQVSSSPDRCDLCLQISFHPGALEECVLQPGSLYVCGCSWLLRPCRHTPLSGKIQQSLSVQVDPFTSMQMVPLSKEYFIRPNLT